MKTYITSKSVANFTVPLHQLLKLFKSPKEWAKQNGHAYPNLSHGNLGSIVESAYPHLRNKKMIYDLAWKDLDRAGFVNTSSLSGIMSGSSLFGKRTSEIGDKFLDFISS